MRCARMAQWGAPNGMRPRSTARSSWPAAPTSSPAISSGLASPTPMPMIYGPAWVSTCNLHRGPEALKGRADPPRPGFPYSGSPGLASDRRLAGHALARLAAVAAGALGGPLVLHEAAARRSLLLCSSCHGGSLFLFSLMTVLPNNESTILRRNRM